MAFAIVNAAIALLALFVAGYSLYLQRRDKRPRLTVTYNDHIPRDEEGRSYYDVVSLRAVNGAHVPVRVVALRLGLPDGRVLPLSEVNDSVRPYLLEGEEKLPYKLEPGERARFSTFRTEVKGKVRDAGFRGGVKYQVAIEDAQGNRYAVDRDDYFMHDPEP